MNPPTHVAQEDPAPEAKRRRSGKDEPIIEALMMGLSQRQVAERTGISRRTVARRLSDPGFQRRLQEHQEEAIKQVRRRVTASAVAAVQVLTRIAGDVDGYAKRDTARTQVYAARAVLSAFCQLQPRTGVDDTDLLGTPIIDYYLIGVDTEALR